MYNSSLLIFYLPASFAKLNFSFEQHLLLLASSAQTSKWCRVISIQSRTPPTQGKIVTRSEYLSDSNKEHYRTGQHSQTKQKQQHGQKHKLDKTETEEAEDILLQERRRQASMQSPRGKLNS